MSRADELKAAVRRSQKPASRAEELTSTPAQPGPSEDEVKPEALARPRAAAPTTARVRRTVDLGPADHRSLQAWCTDAAEELGRARVTGQDVLSALVARLVRDGELSTAIRGDLRAHQ